MIRSYEDLIVYQRSYQLALAIYEMKVLIDFCKDLGFIEVSEHEHLKGAYNEVGKMLNGLSKKWVKEEV